ncbi:MAG: hypothetical protein AB7F38_18650, partial [Piscinibacter sp.]
MLSEEQAAELLRRCEAIAGRGLKALRGRLSSPEGRLAAVWEMLVVDASSRLGKVEYESADGGPDIRLQLPSGRWVWIEATFLQDETKSIQFLSRPQLIAKHALFRKLLRKRQQHKVEGPRLVCVGGDHTSQALGPLWERITVRPSEAAFEAFRKTGALSGALVVRINGQKAHASAMKNPQARDPLTEAEWDHLLKLNFNEWYFYGRSLADQERIPGSRIREGSGVIGATLPWKGSNMKIRVPGPLLLQALTQDKSLATVYRAKPDDPIPKLL